MLQVARLAPKLLGESSDLVKSFLLGQMNEDGGFKDRSGRSDLYYTVFGLDGLLALQAALPLERVTSFLKGFDDGTGCDFVHACCLARCWAALTTQAPVTLPRQTQEAILRRVEQFRSADGGYNPVAGSVAGTAYGGFLALGAYQDLQETLPNPLELVRSLKFLETPDGAWANERSVRSGSTNATAAAVTLLRHLSMPVAAQVGDWLLNRIHPQGGFLAMPSAPIPDLLSTATALHALAGLERDLGRAKEPCLDFVDSLWTNEGAFHGHWGEDTLDCEYTYYGLLALGHLSL